MVRVILASASPRRREILRLILDDFAVIESGADESGVTGAAVERAVRLSRMKAAYVAAQNPGAVVIGADTVVSLSGRVFGKPAGKDEAFAMLKALCGRTHEVVTGVTVTDPSGCENTFYEKTLVTFSEPSDGELWDYVLTGEPLDKAGAYAIQGKGCRFISEISGDYWNVVGLPAHRLYLALKECGAV